MIHMPKRHILGWYILLPFMSNLCPRVANHTTYDHCHLPSTDHTTQARVVTALIQESVLPKAGAEDLFAKIQVSESRQLEAVSSAT